MDYTLIPSLEHIALVRIAALLWNQADIRVMVFWFPFFSSDKMKKWQEVENVVIEKLSHLSLPKTLRRHVLGYLKPIGKQIFSWLECHKNLYFGILHLPNELCWTMQGLLDSKKTAEALIQDRSLHFVTRYKLACTYCLQNDIPELWKEFPENQKELFCNRKLSNQFRDYEFVVCLWTHEIEGRLHEFPNVIVRTWFWNIGGLQPEMAPYQYAFECSAHDGNKAATEFFLKKLTPREKEESLVRCVKHLVSCRPPTNILYKYSNVLCFLITQMDEEQQLQIYTRNTGSMLKCLLDWPWQRFFDETADRVWKFLDVYDYNCLLNQIVLKLIDGYQDWNYRQLFRQFWQKGTISHKRYVLDKCICSPLLTNLLKIKDMENISLLVHDATVAEKVEIVYYRKDLILLLIYNDEWNFLKLLVEHCPSAGDIVCKFQKEFLERDLTCRAKEGLVEEKGIVKKFLKSLSKVIYTPRYADLSQVHWGKEMVRMKRLKFRRKLPK